MLVFFPCSWYFCVFRLLWWRVITEDVQHAWAWFETDSVTLTGHLVGWQTSWTVSRWCRTDKERLLMLFLTTLPPKETVALSSPPNTTVSRLYSLYVNHPAAHRTCVSATVEAPLKCVSQLLFLTPKCLIMVRNISNIFQVIRYI